MAKMELEKEIKCRTYKTRREISNHTELITAIINFIEVFHCIFPGALNPRIEIRVHSPETGENFLYEIDTKYQRKTTSSIERDYARIISKNDITKNFNNVSGVVFFSKGVHIRHREYTIYSNYDIPWDYHNFIKVE